MKTQYRNLLLRKVLLLKVCELLENTFPTLGKVTHSTLSSLLQWSANQVEEDLLSEKYKIKKWVSKIKTNCQSFIMSESSRARFNSFSHLRHKLIWKSISVQLFNFFSGSAMTSTRLLRTWSTWPAKIMNYMKIWSTRLVDQHNQQSTWPAIDDKHQC